MARRSKYGRFQVENQPSDPYKHTDNAYNIDQLDQMIGGPTQTPTHGIGDDFNNPSTSAPAATNQWLAPQDPVVMTNYGARTLYNIVVGLDYNSLPLGATFAFWRPSAAVPLPSGCVPSDGASYTGTDKHSYQIYGITTITVPDLRNAMILGANAAVADGTAAVTPSTNNAADAPGINGVGGSNIPRALAHTHTAGSYTSPDHAHQMNDHVHDAGGHYHVHSHSHSAYIGHSHAIGGSANAATGGASANFAAGVAGNASGRSSVHTVTGGTSVDGGTVGTSDASPVTTSGASGNTGGMIPGTQYVGQPLDRFTHSIMSLSVTGNSGAVVGASLNAVETMPRYVGLLYVTKIRKAGPLHNTVFPVGT